MSKRERLQVSRQRAKLEKNLGSIADLTRLPAAMFIVDISKEHIAVREAKRLNIPVFAIVDTNSDPTEVDFPIPANDDASKSISLIVSVVCKAVTEGLEERKLEKEKEAPQKEDKRAGEPETEEDDSDEEEIEQDIEKVGMKAEGEEEADIGEEENTKIIRQEKKSSAKKAPAKKEDDEEISEE
jgi:small subunit ribosomal protein S2